MARIRTTASTATLILRQTAISVTATLIATAVVSEIRGQFAIGRPEQVGSPLVTSGGKFAARAESPMPSDDDEPILLSAAMPPLMVASAGREPSPIAIPAAAVSPSVMQAVAAEPKVIKQSGRFDARRHLASGASVMPPRRADFVAAEPLSPVPTATTGLSGIWSTARGVVSEASGLGGAVWDKISPMQFVP